MHRGWLPVLMDEGISKRQERKCLGIVTNNIDKARGQEINNIIITIIVAINADIYMQTHLYVQNEAHVKI